MNKKLLVIAFTTLFASVPLAAFGSAGWYPTAKGESITVEYCLPTPKVGVLYLQALGIGAKWKTVATIKQPQFKKDSYCADDFKYGTKQGLYHLKYNWKVNISGGWGLQLYSVGLEKAFYGWPDGITMKGK